jgi:hypothetical protein
VRSVVATAACICFTAVVSACGSHGYAGLSPEEAKRKADGLVANRSGLDFVRLEKGQDPLTRKAWIAIYYSTEASTVPQTETSTIPGLVPRRSTTLEIPTLGEELRCEVHVYVAKNYDFVGNDCSGSP